MKRSWRHAVTKHKGWDKNANPIPTLILPPKGRKFGGNHIPGLILAFKGDENANPIPTLILPLKGRKFGGNPIPGLFLAFKGEEILGQRNL